jgi:hypothetical protein
MRFEGDPQEDDAHVEARVEQVKDRIALLLEEGLAERRTWFD